MAKSNREQQQLANRLDGVVSPHWYLCVWDESKKEWIDLEDYMIIAENIGEARKIFREKYPSIVDKYDRRRYLLFYPDAG